jgi:hypothetical protein
MTIKDKMILHDIKKLMIIVTSTAGKHEGSDSKQKV